MLLVIVGWAIWSIVRPRLRRPAALPAVEPKPSLELAGLTNTQE
jgi:hypothetical protein